MKKPPWYLALPILFVGMVILLPLGYLLIKAFSVRPSEIIGLLFRQRNFDLLTNTLILAMAVVLCSTLIATPMAWLTSSSDLKFKTVFTLAGVLPLAVPAYVTAYALLSLTGFQGQQTLGIDLPSLNGFSGSLIALTFYTFPYLFLNLRSAMLGLNPTLLDSARSLGYSQWSATWHVTLPQLIPAFFSGGLLVFLHVIGDFGVVSLMRYETFSYAIFSQYMAAFDRTYAAWLALIVIALTILLLILEFNFIKYKYYYQTGKTQSRPPGLTRLGKWKWLAYSFLIGILFLSVVIPTFIVLFWSGRGFSALGFMSLVEVILQSASVSVLTAILSTILALLFTYTSIRYPSIFFRTFERLSYIGYAMPPLAFGLAWIFLSLYGLPIIYQTFCLLILAYMLHFLAESIGPIRSAILQIPIHLEEAARSLGRSPFSAFWHTTFPLLRNSMIVSFSFIFLAVMKELPITIMLSPIGFDTLALRLWSHAEEAMFVEAAPYAMVLVIVSLFFVAVVFFKEVESD